MTDGATPYDASLPLTMPALLQRAANLWPQAPVIIDDGLELNFAELFQRARAAASAFLAHGVRKGDTVAIWAPNLAEWIITALGAQSAGAVLVPLNTRMKGREAGDILRRARVRWLFTMNDFLGTDYPALLAGEDLPDLRGIVTFDGDGSRSFRAFLAQGLGPDDPRVDDAIAALEPDDLSDILFTSGTTGAPKGVMSSHGQSIRLFDVWAEVVGMRAGDRMLIINPFFHTFGYKAGWLVCLMCGAAVVPMRTFDIAQAADIIRRHAVSVVPGPPTIFQTLLAEYRAALKDVHSLRVAVTGAATVPPILVERMQSELGFSTVITGYGMTECGVVSMCRVGDSVEHIAHTCGKAAPGLDVKCVDDEGRDTPIGTAGEIFVRGFGVMRGYLDDPEATREAIDEHGWLHTGDIGILDEDGYLRITDRKKDMYITGGFNCYPAEIEKLLCNHPKVEIAAVIGIPDDRLGEVGKAFIVLRPDAHLEAADLISWSRQNMANYKVPREVEFCTQLPRNAAGKVVKTELRSR